MVKHHYPKLMWYEQLGQTHSDLSFDIYQTHLGPKVERNITIDLVLLEMGYIWVRITWNTKFNTSSRFYFMLIKPACTLLPVLNMVRDNAYLFEWNTIILFFPFSTWFFSFRGRANENALKLYFCISNYYTCMLEMFVQMSGIILWSFITIRQVL